jgi:hypothetical protein
MTSERIVESAWVGVSAMVVVPWLLCHGCCAMVVVPWLLCHGCCAMIVSSFTSFYDCFTNTFVLFKVDLD